MNGCEVAFLSLLACENDFRYFYGFTSLCSFFNKQ